MTQTPIDNPRRMAQISPMRTLPLVVLAAFALAGCQSRDAAWQQAYNEKRALALQNGQEPARPPVHVAPRLQQARSEPQMVSGGPVYVPVPVVIDSAPTARPVAPSNVTKFRKEKAA